ncbi:cell division protein FtsQ/DivIB [Nocardioides sp. SYSU D00038]|uniref:cell division protein FtsQ/DivIB n=1 Tax=Nocardioides sp. SYSU D00038 TaxID=2812554 RepID=UPI0019683828|nr:FtsQ-type POTRA domain-containing protein [Nocardioides sp. SYSU D00038]
MARRSRDPAPETTGGLPVVDQRTLRSRRRFARRRWRRRWLTFRPLLLLVLLAVLAGVGVYAVWFSSWLDVERVRVTGADSVGADRVRGLAGVDEGEPLARVDLASVERRVQSLAAVRSADVTRHWPDEVRISVEERVAIAVVEIGGRLRGMDVDGVVFRDYAKAPAGLPRVQTDVGTSADALREAALVVAALPDDLAARVDHVRIESAARISLVLRDGRTVVWGTAEDSEQKAEVLATLLEQVDARTYDVSVPSRPTTR